MECAKKRAANWNLELERDSFHVFLLLSFFFHETCSYSISFPKSFISFHSIGIMYNTVVFVKGTYNIV